MKYLDSTGLSYLYGKLKALFASKVSVDALTEKVNGIPQADWAQNDPTAPDYIKARPMHYGTQAVMDETVTCSMESPTNTMNTPETTVGTTYTVIFDGTSYQCVCQEFGEWKTLGNAHLDTDFQALNAPDTGEPFLIYVGQKPGWMSYFGAVVSGEHNFKLMGDVYTPLPYEYIPEEAKVARPGAGKKSTIIGDERNSAIGYYSTAQGTSSTASGYASHAEGHGCIAYADSSHAEGYATIARGNTQHVQGSLNIVDNQNKYAHIVGNGTEDDTEVRSNAHTLDWDGNAWYAGTVEGSGMVVRSITPSSAKTLKLVADDAGTVTVIDNTAGTTHTLLDNTSRTIALSGDVSGSVEFTGTSNVTMNTTVADNSHGHTIANVTGLQTVIDGKAPSVHNHSVASTTESGFLSAADKTKLDGIDTGANATVVDSALSATSTNPVQNKVVNTALGTKQNSVTGAVSTFLDVNATVSRAIVSNSSGKLAVSSVTSQELGYLSGVTGGIQTQLNAKADTSALASKQDAITGAVSTFTATNATANRVVVSNASGKLAVAAVTSTELGRLSGVTSSVQTQLNTKAPLASPALSGTPTVPTATAGTNSTQVASTAFVQNTVNALLDAKDAFRFVGTINPTTTTILPAAESGHVYRITADGTISTLVVHEGDTVTCCVDGTTSNTPANWFVTHANHDGQVVGPTSAVNNHVATYDGATGKLIKDSGYTIDASVPSGAVFTDTVYTHPATAGYKHIPTGGATSQLLQYSASGTAKWVTPDATPTNGSSNPITSNAVYQSLINAAVESIKEQNGDIPTYFWIGTKAQYDALTKKYTDRVDDTIYITTDEESSIDVLAGVTLNGSATSVVNGVANINAVTGITVNGVSVVPTNGVVPISALKGVHINDTVAQVVDGNAIIDAVTGINLNGASAQVMNGVATVNALTGLTVNGTVATIENGVAKVLVDIPSNYLTGMTLNGAALTPSVNGTITLSAVTGVTVNGSTVTPVNGIAEVNAITGATMNGATIVPSGGKLPLTAVTSIKLNGSTIAPSSGVVTLDTAKNVVVNGTTFSPSSSGTVTVTNVPQVFYGTDDPSASTGKNGDIYIKIGS